MRIAKLYEKALDVLEDDEMTRQWFKMPAKALGGKTPLEYADTGILKVPSAIIPVEYNYLVNPSQPDFEKIVIHSPQKLLLLQHHRARRSLREELAV